MIKKNNIQVFTVKVHNQEETKQIFELLNTWKFSIKNKICLLEKYPEIDRIEKMKGWVENEPQYKLYFNDWCYQTGLEWCPDLTYKDSEYRNLDLVKDRLEIYNLLGLCPCPLKTIIENINEELNKTNHEKTVKKKI